MVIGFSKKRKRSPVPFGVGHVEVFLSRRVIFVAHLFLQERCQTAALSQFRGKEMMEAVEVVVARQPGLVSEKAEAARKV